MGAVDLRNIPFWTDTVADPDASVPIGAADLTEEVSLTEIVIRASSEGAYRQVVDFGCEKGGFELWKNRPLEVRNAGTASQDAIRLTTLELSVKNETETKWVNGATAVVAYTPYSLDWFGWSPFKGVPHRSRPERIQRFLDKLGAVKSEGNRQAAAWAALRTMETDLFGTEDRYYARFRELERTDYIGNPGEKDDHREKQLDSATGDKAARKPRGDKERPKVHLAICKDFDGCRKLLRESDLLADTLEEVRAGNRIVSSKWDDRLSTVAQALSRELMAASICQALAGPSEKQRRRLEGYPALVQQHGSVAVLASWLFEDALIRLGGASGSVSQIGSEDASVWNRIADFDSFTLPSGPTLTRDEIRTQADGLAGSIRKYLRKCDEERGTVVSDAFRAIRHRLEPALDQLGEPGALETIERRFRTVVENSLLMTAALARFGPVPDDIIDGAQKLRPAFPLFAEAVLGPPLDD